MMTPPPPPPMKMMMMTTELSFMLALFLFLFLLPSATAIEQQQQDNECDAASDDEPAFGVLYPTLIITFGLIVYYLISRAFKILPYTGIMFLLGTVIGLGVAASDDRNNHIHETVMRWQNINSELLLLVFLPGLAFNDSISQDVHLFHVAIFQIFNFAFPLVLAGTVLTALVAYYIFPYGWSFFLSLTFGSILSATDPAAVAALLGELGAPPRLNTHIGGESLMNDGSAIVFFSVFSEMFFAELDIEGFGEVFDWGSGIALFCRKALGSVAIGIGFGLLMIMVLCLLNRRFDSGENVWQVTAIFTMAYLNYYVADFVAETSGVMATLSAGLVLHYLGRGWVNDLKLFASFFEIVEGILNTVLFSLGGLVWGSIIVQNYNDKVWVAKDWGYLIVAYLMLLVIRAVLFVGIYPITVRIGLKTNWPETIFQIYSGLRGTVGIALALSLNNQVIQVSSGGEQTIFERQTAQLYQMVGGIAFMTLLVNGITAGPLLKKLGLADEPETRKKIVASYKYTYSKEIVNTFVKLLTKEEFKYVDFSVVRYHVPSLASLTREELCDAIRKVKRSTPQEKYRPPYLSRVLPYLPPEDENLSIQQKEENRKLLEEDHGRAGRMHEETSTKRGAKSDILKGLEPPTLKDMRLLFISLLSASYSLQVSNGELESKHPVSFALESSVAQAETEAKSGKPLNDFSYLSDYTNYWIKAASFLRKRSRFLLFLGKSLGKRASLFLSISDESIFVEQIISFLLAHRHAEDIFQLKFGSLHDDLSESGQTVITESRKQVDLAKDALNSKLDPSTVRLASSHKFCKIIIRRMINAIDELNSNGLVKTSEASQMLDDAQNLMFGVVQCHLDSHEGEIKFEEDIDLKFFEKTASTGLQEKHEQSLPLPVDAQSDENSA